MSFRRKRTDRLEAKHWADFTGRHHALILRSNLPPSVTDTEERWTDFLMHGCIDHHDDPFHFIAEELNSAQYQAVVQLLIHYIEEGNPVVIPALGLALRKEDADRIKKRFGKDDV
jgi:hypothetical protein